MSLIKCLVECQDQQHFKLGVAHVLLKHIINVLTDQEHAFLQAVRIRCTEVLRWDALCEAVMHTVLAPPL